MRIQKQHKDPGRYSPVTCLVYSWVAVKELRLSRHNGHIDFN